MEQHDGIALADLDIGHAAAEDIPPPLFIRKGL